MSIKGFTKRLSFKRSSRDEIPVADQGEGRMHCGAFARKMRYISFLLSYVLSFVVIGFE